MGDESRFRYRRDEGAAESASRARSTPSSAGDSDHYGDSAGDPLAELARLMGEQDPFDDFSGLEPEPAPRAADLRRSPSVAQRYAAPTAPAYPDQRQPARIPARTPPAAPQPTYYNDEEEDDAPGAAPSGWQAPARYAAPARAPEPPRYSNVPARATPAPVPAPAAYGASRGRPEPQAPASYASSHAGQDATVRSGYGSLARQAPTRPVSPDPRSVADDEDDYEDQAPARGHGQSGSYGQPRPAASGRGTQAYDERAYDERYDSGARDGRTQDSRGYDARGYSDEQDEAAYAYSAARRDDDAYDDYDDNYDPDYGEDGYMPPHGDDVYDQEPRKRKGRMALLLGVSVLGLLVAGVAGVFAYNMAVGKPGVMSMGGSTPPVIKADSSPAKTTSPTPQTADGQKLIYDRVGGTTTAANERVVPREEQPVDVTSAISPAATAAPAVPADAASQSASVNPVPGEPKKVRTLAVRADGSLAPSAGSSVSAYAANPPSAAPTLGDPAAAATAASPSVASQTAIASPAPATTGSYVVQVASQRSEADAMGSWKVLQQRYPNLLGSYKVTVKKADLGDKGIYYRAQVGPFTSRDQANELCQALRAQGGDCVITKI